MPYPSAYRPSRRRSLKGSEHIAGRRRSWMEEAKPNVVDRQGKQPDHKLDLSGCHFGHDNPELRRFMSKYLANKVPVVIQVPGKGREVRHI